MTLLVDAFLAPPQRASEESLLFPDAPPLLGSSQPCRTQPSEVRACLTFLGGSPQPSESSTLGCPSLAQGNCSPNNTHKLEFDIHHRPPRVSATFRIPMGLGLVFGPCMLDSWVGFHGKGMGYPCALQKRELKHSEPGVHQFCEPRFVQHRGGPSALPTRPGQRQPRQEKGNVPL